MICERISSPSSHLSWSDIKERISEIRDNNKASVFKKCVYASYLGFFLGILAGLGRVLFLFYSDDYASAEFSGLLLNYLQVSLNQFAAVGFVLGLAFGLFATLIKSVEGLSLAGLIVAIPLLPVVYYLNKNVLPAKFHPLSLAGNGFLLLLACSASVFIFVRYLRGTQFLSRLYSKSVLVILGGSLAVINLAYFLQPAERKLQAASSRSSDLIALFKDGTFGKTVPDAGSPAEEIKKYFTTTRSKRLLALSQRLMLKDSLTIIADAERVTRHEFTFLGVTKTLSGEISWHENPTHDREWLLALNRQDWLIELAMAYYLTQDPRYARTFDAIMRSWFKQNRMPRWKDESDNVWRLIETSARITDSWIEAFGIFWDSEDVSDDVRMNMLASFQDHAMYLAHFRSPRRNHLLQETFGLLAVAAAFPEFKMSEKWLEIAKSRLDFAMRTDVYPDGGYTEGSTYYHRFAVRILQQIADFAKLHDVRLSDFFYVQLEKMYDFLMYVSRPDGIMPQMNDGFHAKNLRPLFEKPAEMFGRHDFRYFATGGASGEPPGETSAAYPYSGTYAMRGDWGDEARYMLVDAGPFGSSHGHEDKLSFELFAYGKPFIVESGTFTYVQGRWRRYFRSTFAHNTIVIDGRGQLRFPHEENWVNNPAEPLPNDWISTSDFDFLEATYSSDYGNIKEDVINGLKHTRRWLFVKPNYWIIWDVVAGTGKHEAKLLFHFNTGISLKEIEGGNLRASYSEGPSLYLKTITPDGARRSIVSGREKPIQGWVSPTYGEKMPAPVLTLASSDNLPITFVTVLFPAKEAEEPFQASLLPLKLDGSPTPGNIAIALKVVYGLVEDDLLLAPGRMETKGIAGDDSSSQLLITRKREGKIVKVIKWDQLN